MLRTLLAFGLIEAFAFRHWRRQQGNPASLPQTGNLNGKSRDKSALDLARLV